MRAAQLHSEDLESSEWDGSLALSTALNLWLTSAHLISAPMVPDVISLVYLGRMPELGARGFCLTQGAST